ncbi:hypothetical protein DTO164E3_1773 [Paecilomyces variotii]|uniref:DUF803 domain protein n=1 Tax=Byssochlamys spectabilis TaxID=264951 RepID=A0A443HYI7_BYSSP|nr:hypothetical protein C8Q69DRAFT_461624 [Paecilomyces variotii]KAJ9204598.1 hypothetical protein DTO164E3_1773 [Paecilomyces variotii]KAJ9208448.1 hypothetical protein DTO032I3_425 [Paecilomyces variotii]KAJ9279984.1 hypothetical protein DTO021D3_3212 [Paecilomyces variotii]KAJ9284547.1 hypothetical protein DTO021C3_7882 [Paecilomyces variotii]KAJ9339600.1 hypothetical protein DTO027B6_7833 [Paecilomyces variotii]
MGLFGDLSPEGSVAIGVIVGLISTSFQAIGLTLQRKSHILEDEKAPYDLHRPPYKRRRWQLGMLLFVVSNIVGSTIQITTLPLPVLSTLQASGLVFNTIFATLILGEPFTRYSLLGTILVCIGAVLIAIFGAIGEPAHSLDQLLALLSRRPFILWMVSTAIIMLIVLAGSRLLKFLVSPTRSKYPRLRFLYTMSFVISAPRVKLIRGLCFGFVSGVLSAHSLLLAKSAVELLVRTIVDRSNQFNRWQSWVILIGMIALALTQLYFMHRGLKLCSTSVLYPFVFCIYNIIAILDGLIYFRQVSQLTGMHAGLIALGTVILLAGVLCLSWRLEDLDAHTGVTVVGPAQTALGPGLGIVEEHAPKRAGPLLLDDEEARVGEREPLLFQQQQQQQQQRSSHQRVHSLPLASSVRNRGSTYSVESAQIWAELDDSEDDVNLGDADVPGTVPRSSLQSRRRSKSNTLSLGSALGIRRALASEEAAEGSPLRKIRNQHLRPVGRSRTWDPRRLQHSALRHTSAPLIVGDNLHQTDVGAGLSHRAIMEYGTQDVPRTPSITSPRRNPLTRSWLTGVNYLRRWTGMRSGSRYSPVDQNEAHPDDGHDLSTDQDSPHHHHQINGSNHV